MWMMNKQYTPTSKRNFAVEEAIIAGPACVDQVIGVPLHASQC